MSLDQNWLEAFKKQIKCGRYPSKSGNPKLEMLTGLVGLSIEHLLCQNPLALDTESDSIYGSAWVQNNQNNNLTEILNSIRCGQFMNSEGEAFAALAMVQASLLEACEDGTEAGEDNVVNKTASYTSEYNDDVVVFNSASALAYTVAPNADVPFPIGKRIELINNGTGDLTITPGSGVTVNSIGSDLVIGAQYSTNWLRKIAENTWQLSGNLT